MDRVNDPVQKPGQGQQAFDTEKHPVVFQCLKCRAVLADSITWTAICNQGDAQTETLCFEAIHAATDGGLLVSQNGFDMGCSYFNVQCQVCNVIIGHWYFSTPQNLDHLRNKFCLFTKYLTKVQLGMYRCKALSMPVDPVTSAYQRLSSDIAAIQSQLSEVVGVVFNTMAEGGASQKQCTTTSPDKMALLAEDREGACEPMATDGELAGSQPSSFAGKLLQKALPVAVTNALPKSLETAMSSSAAFATSPTKPSSQPRPGAIAVPFQQRTSY